MPILALLLPLLPQLIQSVLSIVDAVRQGSETPAEMKAHLDAIAADLQAVVAKVQSVPLP